MKAFFQFIVIVVLFFGSWFALSKVNWIERFRIRQFTEKKQEQLGEWILKMHRAEKKEVTSRAKRSALREIVERIALANKIDVHRINIYLFEADEVNAFALPGGNIVVNTSLIDACDNPDMLAGVLAHEIAHIEYGHVNSKLAREIGLSTLAAASGDNLGVLKQVLKTLASTKFERDQEAEADRIAVRYLKKSNIDPSQLGYFLSDLNKQGKDMPEGLEWISTHPNSAQRAKTIIAAALPDANYEPALDDETWELLRED